jgi:dTDP-4-dehydrorhamnose reductase
MIKILVTGSNGLLGQKISDQLRLRADIQLINTSKGEDRYPNQSGYTYFPMDICDRSAILTLLANTKPDIVIHTAAMTNVDTCESDRNGCWDLNVNAVAHLIEASKIYPFHLVHLSTDFIYDGEDGPYNETANPNPLSYYGESKLAAEKLIENSGISYSIIRTIIVYGVASKMSRNNIVLWAKSVLEKGEAISIVDDQFRMPTLAEDLASACISAGMKKAQGAYNVSGKDYMSIFELVNRIADYYQLSKENIKSISSNTLNQAAKRPPRTGFILAKAIKELDYQPHSFEEGLALIQKQLDEKSV